MLTAQSSRFLGEGRAYRGVLTGCAAALLAVAAARTACGAAVFETNNGNTGIYTFGSPVESGETAKANIGSASSAENGRFAFRAGTVNLKSSVEPQLRWFSAA